MQTATLAEIRRELKMRSPREVTEICLRLARFKKDNKELMTYLLFEAQNEQAYIIGVKQEMDRMMSEINPRHLYYAKKSLRKMLRQLNKYIRYSGDKRTHVELLIHFCEILGKSDIPIERSTVIRNIYERQKVKIEKTIASLHDDLQADYISELERLN
jgi:hypothetical protein